MSGSVCIIGSGPSGLYAADHIARKRPGVQIDILDKLPTPFGLIRAGVAPDHQGTKNIVRQFERCFAREGVRFVGHVDVGKDVALDDLQNAYDAVILAHGAPVDRKLGIEGEDLVGVYGSGAFVGWYNGHPDYQSLNPVLPENGGGVAVVGNGNVALDIARILAKTPEEMAGSDICAHAAATIAKSNITDIYLIGRRGPVEASFTSAELAEMGHLSCAHPLVEGAEVPASLDGYGVDDPKTAKVKEKNLEILRDLQAMEKGDKPITVHLCFQTAPVGMAGENGRLQSLTVEKTRVVDGRAELTGEQMTLPVETVITAIGYTCAPLEGAPLDAKKGIVTNTDGKVADSDGLYVVGWAKRGPSGTVPTNRADSIAVADLVLVQLESKAERNGPQTLNSMLAEREIVPVDFTQWGRINEAETTRAPEGKPREKFTAVAEMLAAARG